MSLLWVKVANQDDSEYPYGPKGPKIYTQEELDQQKEPYRDLQNRLWGSNDLDALFRGSPQTLAPFPTAHERRKQRSLYDRDLIASKMQEWSKMSDKDRNASLEEIDPRELYSKQPFVLRQHMEYYMNDEDKDSGKPSAEKGNVGNLAPWVYRREDGQNIILSGTHRATRALLRGEPLKARIISGPWGAERQS